MMRFGFGLFVLLFWLLIIGSAAGAFFGIQNVALKETILFCDTIGMAFGILFIFVWWGTR